MQTQKQSKEYRCNSCGKIFTTAMRLQHHVAAEHSPRTSRDIYTASDVQHGKPGKP